MKRNTLPNSRLDAPNVILGLMRIADLSDDQIRDLIRTARDAGIDYFDHADIYGNHLHSSEERFAQAMQLSTAERAEVTIQTKAGIVRGGGYYDHSYDYLVGQVEGSLRALQTDYIDVLLLHRPDALVEPDEVAQVFDDLHAAGKVRHFGVSNHTPGQIELLKTAVNQPIIVNQMQLSVTHASMVAQGIAANMAHDQAVVRDSGVVDYCRINKITIQAWSPFQGDGGVIFDQSAYPELNRVIDELAAEFGVPAEAIATAWITRHPANMQVVLGTTTPQRIDAAAQGSDLSLTRAHWYALLKAAGWIAP